VRPVPSDAAVACGGLQAPGRDDLPDDTFHDRGILAEDTRDRAGQSGLRLTVVAHQRHGPVGLDDILAEEPVNDVISLSSETE